MGGGQWINLNNRMMLQHRTGQEMHREVRATLTSFSGLSLKERRGKTW
jgi:hypothetical protein